ncbi:MAG: DUF1731 domain-containing protein, partial [Actinomycetota bacterium]
EVSRPMMASTSSSSVIHDMYWRPEPVTNRQFTETLGRTVNRPTLLPVPAFGPKLLLGSDMAQALLFDSQRVMPEALLSSGHQFHHADIDAGLQAVVNGEEA